MPLTNYEIITDTKQSFLFPITFINLIYIFFCYFLILSIVCNKLFWDVVENKAFIVINDVLTDFTKKSYYEKNGAPFFSFCTPKGYRPQLNCIR